MESPQFEIESKKLFSESAIWQINRNFYQNNGLGAFNEDAVPHHLTSNSVVAKTYAELIFGLLRDLSVKGNLKETVYILELGAGHGRLAFLVLTHLEKLIENARLILPPFCYVLSDIGEDNLTFFDKHLQLQIFYDKGVLDLAYFDAIKSQTLELRRSKKQLNPQDLKQPIVAIANYFFDSIPSELFFINQNEIKNCSVSISSKVNPKDVAKDGGTVNNESIEHLDLKYYHDEIEVPYSMNLTTNDLIESYAEKLKHTYLFLPIAGIQCMQNIKQLSKEGLLLLTVDKGFHEIKDMDNMTVPDIVVHESFSIWVNYHALGFYCEQNGGKAMFPAYSNFHFVLGSLMYMENSASYTETIDAYKKHVDDFGPDDFNTLKKQSYTNAARLNLKELIALFRLSKYDPTFFTKLLPRLKQLIKNITVNERTRVSETMHQVWEMYFSIAESFDLAYDIAGIFYELGYYNHALLFFGHSQDLHGDKADTFYNVALSHYQLRNDEKFLETVKIAKLAFPEFALYENLEKLDLN